jgi:hypothetical protein
MSSVHTFRRHRRYSLGEYAQDVASAAVQNWVARVSVYGGATPSATTQSVLSVFYAGLVNTGLLPLMRSVNCFVPDSLPAALTPLVCAAGLASWNNHAFVSGDVSSAGLAAQSAKYLDTGVVPALCLAGDNAGLTVYLSVAETAQGVVALGCTSASGSFQLLPRLILTRSAFEAFATTGTLGTGWVYATNATWAGFLSGSITPGPALALYKANSGGFSTLATGSIAAGSCPTEVPVYCFASCSNASYDYFGGPQGNLTVSKLSFAAVHAGLTAAQTQTLYNLVQAMRTGLGGGYV